LHLTSDESRYRRINLALLAVMAGITLGALLGVPLLLLPAGAHWGWLLVPAALLTNFFWALHHEAIHGGFHHGRRRNLLAGRCMAILLGSSFHLLRFAHLMHHRHNRNPIDRPDTYDPALTRRFRARVVFLGSLVCGLYLAELVAPVFSALPRARIRRIIDRVYRDDDKAVAAIRLAAHRTLLEPRRLAMIRVDAALAWALIIASAVSYGRHWPMLVGFLGARGLLISVFDNVYHFATPIDRPDYARNLSLPAPLRLLVLNMNLHRIHHARPALPWWALPAEFRAAGDVYDAPLLRVAAAQFAGPVPVTALQGRDEAAMIQGRLG
jgi:fatty acid desaturase